VTATSAGGPQPPAGGTLRDVADSKLRAQRLHEAMHAQTEVVKAARAWRRSLPHERITGTVDEDLALLYAVDQLEVARSQLYATLYHASAPDD
jgi:hypothetical protein